MKVIHFLSTNSFSGAENVVCQIIKMFENDTDIEMIYCSPDGKIRKKLSELGIAYVPIKNINPYNVRKVIKEFKPDVVHAHDPKMCCICAMVTGRSVKVVGHIHGNHPYMRKKTPQSILFSLASHNIDQLIWVSKSTLSEYWDSKRVAVKSTMLANIINVEEVRKRAVPSSDKYDVVFLGRLSEEKDPLRFVELCCLIHSKNPNVSFAMIGDGPLSQSVEERVQNCGLSNVFGLLGFQPNPIKYLANSNVMVMTSVHEGTPMAALEALSVGVPIVSTPTDGMVELIHNDENGYLSSSNEELANKILEIYTNAEYRKGLSINAQSQMNEEMNVERYKEKLITIYEEVI